MLVLIGIMMLAVLVAGFYRLNTNVAAIRSAVERIERTKANKE